MKNFLFFLLIPITSVAQIQIGSNINGEASEDSLGWGVSLSYDGSTMAVGAPLNNGNGSNSGHVRVFKNISNVWTQIGADIDGENANDYSGESISLSSNGDIIAIGAYGNDGNGSNSGHVRVYKNISNVWTQIGSDINGEGINDNSGYSVSIASDGTVLAVGAPINNGTGAASGHVRVYKNVSNAWVQINSDINGEAPGDHFGSAVSLASDGNTLAVGAMYNNGSGPSSGHVRVFKNIAGNWTQIGADIDGEAAGDEFGCSVSLSSDGNVVAIGAFLNEANGQAAGHTRVYKNTSGSWIQIGNDIDGQNVFEEFGWRVSLSADGNTVAISAVLESTNGYNTGEVSVYKNLSGIWSLIGNNLNGENIEDRLGVGISLSANGNVLAVGADYNDEAAWNAGQVRAYDLTNVLNNNDFVLTNFSIHPNPATDIVNINLNENLQLDKINIYNALGQLIKTSTNNKVTVSKLTKGLYFFEILTNQGKATKKIIID